MCAMDVPTDREPPGSTRVVDAMDNSGYNSSR